MSNAAKSHGGLQIVEELLNLTRKMAASEDADFLVASIDRREQLMREFDRLKADEKGARAIKNDQPEISKMIAEIIKLDKGIGKSLHTLREDAKRELENVISSQKVLNYTNNAISSSGSYMDVKK